MTALVYRATPVTDESVFFVATDGESADLHLWTAASADEVDLAVCAPLLTRSQVHPVIWEAALALVNHEEPDWDALDNG